MGQQEEQPTINTFPSKPLWRDDDSLEDENIHDIDMMMGRKQCSQKVFSDEEENPRVRKSTKKERRA